VGHAVLPLGKSISGTNFDYMAITAVRNMADFGPLVAEAKKRNILWSSTLCYHHLREAQVVQSRARGTSEGRLYIGATAKATAANNWISIFGHSAWQLIRHAASTSTSLLQGDSRSNWRNPEVASITTTMGLDEARRLGFRLALSVLFEDRSPHESSPGTNAMGPNVSREYTTTRRGPRRLREMRKVTTNSPAAMLSAKPIFQREELPRCTDATTTKRSSMDMQFAMMVASPPTCSAKSCRRRNQLKETCR